MPLYNESQWTYRGLTLYAVQTRKPRPRKLDQWVGLALDRRGGIFLTLAFTEIAPGAEVRKWVEQEVDKRLGPTDAQTGAGEAPSNGTGVARGRGVREWMELRAVDGAKHPVWYSIPDDMPNEVLRRFEDDRSRCVGNRQDGKRCGAARADARRMGFQDGGFLTLCPTHVDKQPEYLFAVDGGNIARACPCGCGFDVLGSQVVFRRAERV